MSQRPAPTNPHAGQPILAAGVPLAQARAAMLLVHGRGSSARDILGLASQLHQPGFAFIAPQAAQNTWYPNPFMTPIAGNEPWLSSALAKVAQVLAEIAAAGIPPDRT